MSNKIGLIAISVVVVSCISLYSQSTISCDNTLNTSAKNYETCKKTLFDEVNKTLIPLIKERDALKKELDTLTNLLKNFDAEKEKLTKSIAKLKNDIKTKGCINCNSPATTSSPTPTTTTSGSSSGNKCVVGNHPSCKLPNICQLCSGLTDHASGKSLCDVCGCNCNK